MPSVFFNFGIIHPTIKIVGFLMSFIVKGKAAIDVLVVKLGKSGGSLTLQSIIIFLGSILAAAPYIAIFLILIVGLWIKTVNVINRNINDDAVVSI